MQYRLFILSLETNKRKFANGLKSIKSADVLHRKIIQKKMANGLTTDCLKQKRIRIQITEAVGDVVVVEVVVEVRTSLRKLDADVHHFLLMIAFYLIVFS